ncbi:hypothetical protein JCM19992_17740 [Thermostilla marina]
MRILHFNEHLSWSGGVETYLLNVLPLLEARGIESHVAYAKGTPDLVRRAVLLPEIGRIGPAARKRAYQAAKRLLQEVAPDIIHVHRVYNVGVLRACVEYGRTIATSHDYMYLCPASTFFHRRTKTVCGRTAGIGCFATTIARHCMTPRPRFALDYYHRVRWIRRNHHRFAAVICPSESVRERYQRAGFSLTRLHTIPYFCPLAPLERPRKRPKTPTLLFVGRMRPVKGYDVLVRALGELEGVHGLFVGDADEATQEKIRNLAAEAGCLQRIEIHPWADRAHIRDVYERATVFVFPSIWPETLGIVGLEAMACGVPVIASDIGGVRQWLEHGTNGLVVPPKNPQAIAEAVRRMLGDEELFDSMETAALETIRKRFLPEQHIGTLTALYETVTLPAAPQQ